MRAGVEPCQGRFELPVAKLDDQTLVGRSDGQPSELLLKILHALAAGSMLGINQGRHSCNTLLLDEEDPDEIARRHERDRPAW